MFFHQAPGFERSLTQSGIHLFKIWFTVSAREQERRFEARKRRPAEAVEDLADGRRSGQALREYGEARDAMLAGTDHADAPWTIVNSNEKKRARLESIRHVLSSLDYDHKDSDVARPGRPRRRPARGRRHLPLNSPDVDVGRLDGDRARARPDRR